MDKEIKRNLVTSDTWLRLLFMLIFMFIYGVTKIVVAAIVVLQFLFVLTTGKANEHLLKLGGELSEFVKQILQYLMFISDDRPFPFGDWPQQGASVAARPASKPKAAKKAVTKKRAPRKKAEKPAGET